jgi:hypothetical protein
VIELNKKQKAKLTELTFEIAKGFLIVGFLAIIFDINLTVIQKILYSLISIAGCLVFFIITLYILRTKKYGKRTPK